MSSSTVVDWLNENSLRAYPLTSGSVRYIINGVNTYDLYGVIVDALFVFSNLTDFVQVQTIQTSSTDITITVVSGSISRTFTLANYTSASYPQYLRNSNHDLLVLGSETALLPVSTTFSITNALFEPSVSNEVVPTMLGLTGFTLAGTVLTGTVTLQEGYQLSLIPGDGVLTIEVGRGEGNPLPCGNILNITPDCSSVVSSVNGVTPNKTGNVINFVGKNHINVYDDPDNNRIYIGYDFVLADVPTQNLPAPPILI